MADYKNVPDFDSLPKVKGMPQGCAWGIFDKDGKKDHLGTLNYISPEVVRNAVLEVQEGSSVSLNWPMGAIKTPGFGRKGLDHRIIDFMDTPLKVHGFDDEVSFNTQCSSQWDSLVHFAHQPTGLSYNGVKPTAEGLKQDFGELDLEQALPTLNHWHQRCGLVARGVLLDYVAYAEAKGIKYSPYDNNPIDVATLEAVKKHQGTDFRHGDVLLVRSGFTEGLDGASAEEQEEMLSTHSSVGVEGCEASARWVWNNHFSAVAGDAVAFENLPPAKDGKLGAGAISELGE